MQFILCFVLQYFFVCQAARDGRTDVIKHKLQKIGRNKARLLKTINKGDEADITPLHYAVRYGHVNVVKLLSESGAGEQVKFLIIFSSSGNSHFFLLIFIHFKT